MARGLESFAALAVREGEPERGVLLAAAATALREAAGLPPLSGARAERYLAPARYDDEIRIVTTLAESTPRMIRFDYELFNQTGTRLALGFTKHVFCGRDVRPTKLPEKYRPIFET